MQQVFHVDEPTRSIQSGPRPFRRRQLCDSPLVSVHVLGRLLSAGLVSKVPWGGGAALTSFFSRQSTRSCHAGQDGASPSARVHACALFSGTGPIRRRADHCPGISLARHAGWRACVRAGDLSRVGLAGSPNPHRSSPGGSEDGVSGGCAHHRESTVHPRCPLHPAVLPLFFFWTPAHRVRAKNLSQRPAHRVRIVHLFWSSLPCERALGGGAAASKLQPCTPSNQPPRQRLY